MNLQAVAVQLRSGKTMTFIARGSSMEPRVRNGSKVTVRPVGESIVRKGDVVLAKVRGRIYLHLVAGERKGQLLIANNHGHANGWTPHANVYGVLVEQR